ncbi:MAG: LuxR C-terminal-related transcriptional regulator [Acidimicrobiales bacterium]
MLHTQVQQEWGQDGAGAMPAPTRLARMSHLLHGALTVREVQLAYLQGIGELIPAGGYGLYQLDPESGDPVDVAADVPGPFLERYEREGRADDPVLAHVATHLVPIDSSRVLPDGEWRRSAVFDVLSSAGFRHSLEAPVVVDGALCGTLNMARPEEQLPFTVAETRCLAAVSDEVALALTRAMRHELMARRAVLLADALDALPQAVVVDLLDGERVFSNRAALRPVPGRPTSLSAEAASVIAENLEPLRHETRRVILGTVGQQHGGAGDLSAGARAPGRHLAVKSVRLPFRDGAVLSFIYERSGGTDLPPCIEVLSSREQQIAELVSQGLTTEEIASLTYISRNTVKQHLKRIFGKLDVHSRAELVQAMWSTMSERRDGPTGADGDAEGSQPA